MLFTQSRNGSEHDVHYELFKRCSNQQTRIGLHVSWFSCCPYRLKWPKKMIIC